MIMLASLTWEEARQSHHRRSCRRWSCPRPPLPPPLGPPSRSSMEDYNQKTSSRWRRHPPWRTSGLASHPHWMMGCLET